MHARLTPRTLPARAGHPITAAHRPVCPGRRPAAADRQPAHTEGLARRTTAELSPSVTKRRSGTRRTQRRTASATCRLKSACSCSFAAGTFPHPCGSVCSTDAMDRGSDARRRETPRLPVQDGCRTPWTSGTIVDGGRLTHNPEVAGSNPAPATRPGKRPPEHRFRGCFLLLVTKLLVTSCVRSLGASPRGRTGIRRSVICASLPWQLSTVGSGLGRPFQIKGCGTPSGRIGAAGFAGASEESCYCSRA